MVLAPAPDDPPRDTTTITDDVSLRGLTVARINPAVMAELNLPMQAEGVAVLMAEDLAARAGFQTGDVIVAINGLPVATPADVALAATAQVRVWVIDLVRQGSGLRLRFRF